MKGAGIELPTIPLPPRRAKSDLTGLQVNSAPGSAMPGSDNYKKVHFAESGLPYIKGSGIAMPHSARVSILSNIIKKVIFIPKVYERNKEDSTSFASELSINQKV